MRCLVTGASGHLGSYVVQRLVKEGAEVFALVRPQSDLWRLEGVIDRIKVVRADLSDEASTSSVVSQSRPELVFHLAWQGVTSEFKNDPAQTLRNLPDSVKLCQLVLAAGCRTWIGIGSQAEYGADNETLTEHTPVNPVTGYGTAKQYVGLLTKGLCDAHGARYVWLRLLATYGPKDDERHLIPSVIGQLLRGQRPALTPAEQRWDYLYVEDAANAIYRAAVTEGAQGVYNLGSGTGHIIRDIVERIRDLIDPSLPLGFGELPYPPDQIMYLQTSIERLSLHTRWKPKVNLDVGLRRTVNWYRSRSRSGERQQ